ncbi:uncharacterized protein LOC112083501 [Eutrema salsugineum]|uniref:uncharacterized protein LOC112083501 n=1 Tax=Eutrema salsugineum TaxID=72664 RepID=UPI000CED6FA0|nr:uncharacterized protein LOC112083501 [Eutrema salsugineum]
MVKALNELEELKSIQEKGLPWYADIVNHLSCGVEPPELNNYQKKKFYKDIRRFFWDEPYLYVLNKDHLYRRCVAEEEIPGIFLSAMGLHMVATMLLPKQWQRSYELDSGGQAVASPTTDSKVVVKLFKTIIIPRFGVPRCVISDGGSHFINKTFEGLLKKYGVKHKVVSPYHRQTSGKVEVSNRTSFKTPISTSPFNFLYGKSCHLTVELEYKAWWAVKLLKFDIKNAQEKRLFQLQNLDEIRLDAYESSRIYKERTNNLHDKKIMKRDFKEGDLMLLFNSKLKLFPRKLKSRWSGPFKIKEEKPYGAVVLEGKNG